MSRLPSVNLVVQLSQPRYNLAYPKLATLCYVHPSKTLFLFAVYPPVPSFNHVLPCLPLVSHVCPILTSFFLVYHTLYKLNQVLPRLSLVPLFHVYPLLTLCFLDRLPLDSLVFPCLISYQVVQSLQPHLSHILSRLPLVSNVLPRFPYVNSRYMWINNVEQG